MAILWQRHLYTLFKPIPRKAETSRRVIVAGLGGRFADELLSGMPDVLMPTFRATFGLSYAQISLLSLALNYVALLVELLFLFILIFLHLHLLFHVDEFHIITKFTSYQFNYFCV